MPNSAAPKRSITTLDTLSTYLAPAAALLYLAATVYLGRRLAAGQANHAALGGMIGGGLLVAALILHGMAVWSVMQSDTGTHLDLAQATSLMLWVMGTFVTLSSFALPVASLMLLVAPISSALLLLLAYNGPPTTPGSQFPALLLGHITASISAVSVLMLAFLQALLLRRVEFDLKRRTLQSARLLPPLETMERLLFAAIWVGLALLIVAISSGFAVLDDLFATRGMIHHTVLLSGAAVAYGVLLIGHHLFGWRGTTAVRWVIGATALLALGYFGSKFVLEVLLVEP